MDKKQVITLVVGAFVVGWGVSHFVEKSSAPVENAKTDDKKAPDDYIALKIDGKAYTKSHIESQIDAATAVGGQPNKFDEMPEALQKNIVESFVRHELLKREADDHNMMSDPEVRRRVEFLRSQAMIDVYLSQKIEELVTPEKLKAAYEEKIKGMTGEEEMQAAHILVDTEEEAKAVLADINGGKSFTDEAKAKSKDTASGANGGDLGYFTKDQMIPEFANAAFALKEGEVSQPIKSVFGWHIIKAGGRRPVSAPTFEQMEPQLKNELANKAMSEYLNSLVTKAQVSYMKPDGTEVPVFENLKPAAAVTAPAGEAAPAPGAEAPMEAAPSEDSPAEAGDSAPQQ